MLSTDSLILKDGPLAHVWKVAHSVKDASAGPTKKLEAVERDVAKVSIPKAVKEVEKASAIGHAMYLNLRFTSYLLLGIAKLYQMSAFSLLRDCNATLERVRTMSAVEPKAPPVQTNSRKEEAMQLLEAGLAPLLVATANTHRTPSKQQGSTVLKDAAFYNQLLGNAHVSSTFRTGLDFIGKLHQAFPEPNDDFGLEFNLVPMDIPHRGMLEPPEPQTPRRSHVHFDEAPQFDNVVPKTPVTQQAGLPTPITRDKPRGNAEPHGYVPMSPISPTRQPSHSIQHDVHVDEDWRQHLSQDLERKQREQERLNARKAILEKNDLLINGRNKAVDEWGEGRTRFINELYDEAVDAAMVSRRRGAAHVSIRALVKIPIDDETSIPLSTFRQWQTNTSDIMIPQRDGMHHCIHMEDAQGIALQQLATVLGPHWVYKSDPTECIDKSPEDTIEIRRKERVPIFSAVVDGPLPAEFTKLLTVEKHVREQVRRERSNGTPESRRKRLIHDMMGGEDAILLSDEPVGKKRGVQDDFGDRMEVDISTGHRMEQEITMKHRMEDVQIEQFDMPMDQPNQRTASPAIEMRQIDGNVYNWNKFLPASQSQRTISFFESLPPHATPRDAAAKMFHDLLALATSKRLQISQREAYGDIEIVRAMGGMDLVAPTEEEELKAAQPSKVSDSEETPKPKKKRKTRKVADSSEDDLVRNSVEDSEEEQPTKRSKKRNK